MNENELQGVVLRVVLTELARAGERFVPVSSSNHHIHLCSADMDRLFGAGYQLTKMRDLAQPGQYACNESVTLEAEKGTLSLRVVGPTRKETQVELSYTDCYKIGIQPMLRMSGDTVGTPGCTLANGDIRIALNHGVIVAARHLHMSPAEAEGFGLKDGDAVALQVEGERAAILEKLIVRSGEAHSLEAHIDKDEANACGIADGQLCRILCTPRVVKSAMAISTQMHLSTTPKQAQAAAPSPPSLLTTYIPRAVLANVEPSNAVFTNPMPLKALETKTTLLDLSYEPHCFVTEEDVLTAARNGHKLIRHASDAIITPLARDAAVARGIEWIELT
jgi:putative phosphotransacetylase